MSHYGEVLFVSMKQDTEGMAFVRFADPFDAQMVITMVSFKSKFWFSFCRAVLNKF